LRVERKIWKSEDRIASFDERTSGLVYGYAHRLAYTSTRSDVDRHFGSWQGAALGGSIEEIRLGDVVWFAPNEKHWHGATPTTAMTHIAIQEALDGKVVDWMEKVTDEQYGELTSDE
jgi:hypothetical protein